MVDKALLNMPFMKNKENVIMKKHLGFKKTTAFLMSMALVAGAMPANAGGLFNVRQRYRCQCSSRKKAPAVGTLYKEGYYRCNR